MESKLASLDDIANKYGTDKGTAYPAANRHGYTLFYEPLMEKYRDEKIKLLEIGVCLEVGTGGESIYMWNEYFQHGLTYTFDIVDMSNHPSVKDNDRVFFYRGTRETGMTLRLCTKPLANPNLIS